jgi:phosphoglycolate phosphatase-like HAD superfamily hydrolase
VVTASDVTYPKPHPECLFKILDYFGADPEEGMYIGDSETDRQAALSTGVPFVAYKNSSLKAWAHIIDHLEILNLVNGDRSVFS